MIPIKFKQASEINLKSKLLEYFIKLEINNEELITFITQLQLNRNVISNLKITYDTLEEVERLRTILTVYISDLNAELINTYMVIKECVEELINFLNKFSSGKSSFVKAEGLSLHLSRILFSIKTK